MTTPTVPPSLAKHGITAEQLDNWIARSRGRQGLPFHVHDPAILAKVAALAQEAIAEAEAIAAGPVAELREHAAKQNPHLEAQVIQAA